MANIYDMSDTWNDGATTFTSIKMNVTDTASSASSLLMDLQVGGTSKLNVTKGGEIFLSQLGGNGAGIIAGGVSITHARAYIGQYGLRLGSSLLLQWASGSNLNALDLTLARDAANTLAQRNGVNAQTFNLYNTYTDASNYERGVMRWNANVLEIGTEALGTGTVRNLVLKASETTVGTALNAARINFATTAHYIQQNVGGIEIVGNNHLGLKVILNQTNIYSDTVVMSGSLPTADPVNAGQLWNDSGTLKISAG